ncbi:MAG: hypothetical protein FWC77_02200 [Defluviitaleaceae bacterium]|nr:hypothetical protein [Defluviitaleaceae bacterium]
MRNIRAEEQKIMRFREAKGIGRMTLARAMRVDVDLVKQVESGNAHYTNAQLRLARNYLNLTNMPLSELEVAAFKRRLYIMYDLVKDRRFNEAKEMCKEMACVLELDDCDDDLPQLYRLFEAHILIYADNALYAAEKKLEQYRSKSYEPTAEHNYHYYFNMGAIHIRRMGYEASLSFYKKAFELSSEVKELTPEDIKRLHLSIAACYAYLNFPFRAISYLENARSLCSNKRASVLNMHFDIELALNYIKVNELTKAEKLLEYCHICANSIKDDFYVGLVLHNYGRLRKQQEKWKEAIDYLNQAIEYFEEGSMQYLRVLHDAVCCWANFGKFAHAKRLLMKTQDLYKDDVCGVIYEALRHYVEVRGRLSLYNDKSVEYIETVALPHFMKTFDYFLAVDYYKLLGTYYVKKNDKKSLMMSESILRIYERCLISVDIGVSV